MLNVERRAWVTPAMRLLTCAVLFVPAYNNNNHRQTPEHRRQTRVDRQIAVESSTFLEQHEILGPTPGQRHSDDNAKCIGTLARRVQQRVITDIWNSERVGEHPWRHHSKRCAQHDRVFKRQVGGRLVNS